MTTREEVRTAWANEELAQVITQLTALHTEFESKSTVIPALYSSSSGKSLVFVMTTGFPIANDSIAVVV